MKPASFHIAQSDTVFMAELKEMAQQIAKDQADWIDSEMKKIMPGQIYDQRESNPQAVEKWIKENQISLVHIRDTMMVRIMKGPKVISEWKAQFIADKKPIDHIAVMKNAGRLDQWQLPEN